MANSLASSLSSAPKAVAISAVTPVEMPLPMEIMTKKTGSDSDMAASVCVEIRPPK